MTEHLYGLCGITSLTRVRCKYSVSEKVNDYRGKSVTHVNRMDSGGLPKLPFSEQVKGTWKLGTDGTGLSLIIGCRNCRRVTRAVPCSL
jgi:hypothetical protein